MVTPKTEGPAPATGILGTGGVVGVTPAWLVPVVVVVDVVVVVPVVVVPVVVVPPVVVVVSPLPLIVTVFLHTSGVPE